jgi:hypothetical protein
MTKNTINQICEKLTILADNYAEQERTLRGLIAVIRAAKDEDEPKVVNTLPEDKLGTIERLLKELMEKKEGKSGPFQERFPFDTHPHVTPYVGDQPGWMQYGPQCIQSSKPELWHGQPLSPMGATISVVPCSSPSDQKIIYADANGTHVTTRKD